MGNALTTACLVLGAALAATGFALSAHLGTLPHLDPLLPGSPLVFIAGLALMASAALVYELLPERHEP